MARLTGNWRNLPVINEPLLHPDQENWVAVTRGWWDKDGRHLHWVMDLQGLGKTHAFIAGIEAKTLNTSTQLPLRTAADLWRFYFDSRRIRDDISQTLGDSLFDIGATLATYWVRALWDFVSKATNSNLSRPASLVDAVPRLLDLKELVRLLRIPLAKGEVAHSSPNEHAMGPPIVSGATGTFAWQVLDNRGERHTIERAYLAEQFLRCFDHR